LAASLAPSGHLTLQAAARLLGQPDATGPT